MISLIKLVKSGKSNLLKLKFHWTNSAFVSVGPSCGAEISSGGGGGSKVWKPCICCNRMSQTEGAASLKLTGDRLTGEMRGRSERMRGGGGCERSRRGRKVKEERGEFG